MASALKQLKKLFTRKREEEQLTQAFSVLGDKSRYRIFRMLMEQDGEHCVTEVAGVLDVSIPAASQHLKVMEQAGLILRERDGQKICYCLNREHPLVDDLIRFIKRNV